MPVIVTLLPCRLVTTVGQLIFKDIIFRGLSKICFRQKICGLIFEDVQNWQDAIYQTFNTC